jgi:hypothetical protein
MSINRMVCENELALPVRSINFGLGRGRLRNRDIFWTTIPIVP